MTRVSLLGACCAVALALAGCGNQSETSPVLRAMKGLATAMVRKGDAPPPAPITRADLAALKVPVIQGEMKSGNSTFYLVPIARQGAAETWGTSDDLTVTFRNGVLAETRGFGPDIMESTVPSLSQLQSGQGTHRRSYVYLDGGDQLRRFDYDCSIQNAGAETITVVGQQHSTRHVVENCTGKWASFTNEYWFESSGKLRKSKELLVPEWGYLDLARVIDS